MTFNRPKDLTITQMAQWVDNTVDVQENQDRLVEYLYHIVYSHAVRASLFNDYQQYDDFSLFCVSKLLFRFSNKEEPRVKSIVNYIRTVITPWKAEYIRDFCVGDAEINLCEFDISDFGDYLVDASSAYDKHSYSFYSVKITDVIKQQLLKIPVKKNSCEWYNIYTSCLLTLQDRIISATTLCKKHIAKEHPELVNRIIRSLRLTPPILFHVEESKASYITVLVNEIIHAISAELTHYTHTNVSVSTCLQNLIKAANNEEDD